MSRGPSRGRRTEKPAPVRRLRFRPVHGGHPMPDAFLHLLEGADLNLANALARYAEFLGKLAERDRLFGETARLENAPLAVVEHREGFAKHLAPVVELLVLEQQLLLARRLVDQ